MHGKNIRKECRANGDGNKELHNGKNVRKECTERMYGKNVVLMETETRCCTMERMYGKNVRTEMQSILHRSNAALVWAGTTH